MIESERILEFNVVKEKLMELAYTDKAKEEIRNMKPYMSEGELQAKMRDTTEAKELLEKAGNPPLISLKGIGELIGLAEKGGCLTGEQLEQVGEALTGIKRLKDYLNRCKQYELSIPYYEENLDAQEEVREAIHQNIRDGKVDDYASKLLQSLRNSISVKESKMREKADAVMRANKECMSDSFSTMRNGHICIPVKTEYKVKIGGTVLDKSSTGSTLFIEPAAVGKYYDELQILWLEEENEVKRILYSLSGMVADAAEVMEQNKRTIEKLDFMFAKGRLSVECEGVQPDINTERRIHLTRGRHPLMDKSINIPLEFQIGNGTNGIVITGPNTGGKTVAIKTVALNCMMAQCGLHVTCEKADICMNNAYLCDIGDGQNLSENLSTFSAHITNVLDILKKADKDSLVIMDELGSGTDPTEGMGIAVAILAELKKTGALYLVTTHYPEIKTYAEKEEGIVNAKMTFDKDSLKPLYQLVIGEAGESCAFHIANRLGMPATMLKRAVKEAYGSDVPEGLNLCNVTEAVNREPAARLQKKKAQSGQQSHNIKFQLGDSVMIYPEKKIGIVCETANEKGVLRVQLPGKKIYINHKRIKLHVAASELYPENYDFSIIFESVENRKLRHQMDRKYMGDQNLVEEES